jgi:hypothetical protein
MIRALAAALLLAAPALAQAPQVAVALEPEGPVTVGTPVEVTVTVLVPTFMPAPPAWPDLEIADAITRLPERATHPVTGRVGDESWSGVARRWEITPQRPADYELGEAAVTVTYADPATNAPVEASVALPAIAFSAVLPAGAEGMDPFIAAAELTLTAAVDGLPAAPKPGDAFTLTLTASASGPAAILLPPLAAGLPAPAGLRAYPREPVLTDGPPAASRTETVAYVIERPGSYRLPAVSLDWWNTAASGRETAATAPIRIDVPAPPGWREPGAPGARAYRLSAIAAGVLAVLLLAWLALRRRRASRPPSERRLYRDLRRAIRSGPAADIRPRFAVWRAALPAGAEDAAAEDAFRALDRLRYGPRPSGESDAAARRGLLAAVAGMRASAAARRRPAPLAPLNP